MLREKTTLALDVGQSGIRAQLIEADQKRELEFAGIRTDLELFPQLVQVVSQALGDNQGSVTVAIGMTGLTKSQSRPNQLLQLLDQRVENVYLAHDSITGFLGSIGVGQGTVTAVGTGVVTLSVGPEQVIRVDGWGNLIGDAGSAYWIGRASLEAGMKAYDGRTAPTELTNLIWKHFSHPEEAYIELQTDPNRVAAIASLAREVLEFANDDWAARAIVEAAGSELALSAATAAKRSGSTETGPGTFSWAGSVMRAELLRQSFAAELIKLIPEARVIPPLGDPIDGVALLPTIPAFSPLRAGIHMASKDIARVE